MWYSGGGRTPEGMHCCNGGSLSDLGISDELRTRYRRYCIRTPVELLVCPNIQFQTGNTIVHIPHMSFRWPASSRVPFRIPKQSDQAGAEEAAYVDETRRELEQWDIPVQVIWSDGDMAWKADEGARIAQLVPNGRFHLVHHAGHFLQEDAGKEVAEQMIRFSSGRRMYLPG